VGSGSLRHKGSWSSCDEVVRSLAIALEKTVSELADAVFYLEKRDSAQMHLSTFSASETA